MNANYLGVLFSLVVLLGTRQSFADPIAEALGDDPSANSEFPATIVELTIPSSGEKLPGHIYLAAGQGPHPTVVFLHGIPGNERNLDLAQNLRRFGFNTLFFHYRGAWGATGAYRITHLPEDALAVLAFLQENSEQLRVAENAVSFLGHSLGGFTALAAGASTKDVACVVALAPANVGVWKQQVEAGGPQIDRLSAYADTLFMLNGLSGDRLKEELAYTPLSQLDTAGFGPGLSGKDVLLIVGEQDTATPPAVMFDPVVSAYQTQESLRLTAHKIEGDHSFSGGRVALSRLLMDWMDQRCR
ncbi:MAG: alpha/beta fold hydrolase [Pseudomonadota bacterium]